MRIYGKFRFKDSLTRNMLSRSNMDHCLADETQKESKSIYGKFKFKDSLARNMLSRSNMDHMNLWNMLSRSNMDQIWTYGPLSG